MTNVFVEKPQRELCQAALNGCTQGQEVRIDCKTEGTSVFVCASCAQVWRVNAKTESLYNRCPRCALWHGGTRSHPVSPASQVPLKGEVAAAIDAAMHAEGLLIDQRHKILARLYRDAYWLTFVDSPVSLPESA